MSKKGSLIEFYNRGPDSEVSYVFKHEHKAGVSIPTEMTTASSRRKGKETSLDSRLHIVWQSSEINKAIPANDFSVESQASVSAIWCGTTESMPSIDTKGWSAVDTKVTIPAEISPAEIPWHSNGQRPAL